MDEADVYFIKWILYCGFSSISIRLKFGSDRQGCFVHLSNPSNSRMVVKKVIARDVIMPNQTRVAKVLATLLASMTIGAALLMASGHNPPAAGPFSLWTYCRLDPVKDAIRSQAAQYPDRWNRIEVYYSGTNSGNIEQLASYQGLTDSGGVNFHFCICNGKGGFDGDIQPTEKWQRQLSAAPDQSWFGSTQTIRICVIADGKTTGPTDCQIKRIQVLSEELCRTFRIRPQSVYYPGDWR